MTSKTSTSQTQHEPFTRPMIIRAVIKGVMLFILFNMGYGALQPVSYGLLPSLYNHILPGRTRFLRNFEYDAYRMVDSHIVSQASPSAFNIVILGSSEIWGSRTGPAEAVPAYMDRIGMVAQDGRPVRIYNLGFPFPNGIKDLMILDMLARKHLPVDLVMISSFSTTLSVTSHFVIDANPQLRSEVLDHYHLTSFYESLLPRTVNIFPLWDDRTALSAWSTTQLRGLMWTLNHDDMDTWSAGLRAILPVRDKFPAPNGAFDAYGMRPSDAPALEKAILRALAQFSQEQAVPLIVLEAPLPVETNQFDVWLQEETANVQLPLLDCWAVFRDPAAFEDFYHITPQTHEPYAHILAKQLSDPAMSRVSSGLPLMLPADFQAPANTCEFHPS